MEPRHLYTIQWTQPYATEYQRPYLRAQQHNLEQMVELWLDQEPDYPDAREVIERIKQL